MRLSSSGSAPQYSNISRIAKMGTRSSSLQDSGLSDFEGKNTVIFCYLCDSAARITADRKARWHPIPVVCTDCGVHCGRDVLDDILHHQLAAEELRLVTSYALAEIYSAIDFPEFCSLRDSEGIYTQFGTDIHLIAHQDAVILQTKRANRLRILALRACRPPPRPQQIDLSSAASNPTALSNQYCRLRAALWEEGLRDFWQIWMAECRAGCQPQFGDFRCAVNELLQSEQSSFQRGLMSKEERRRSESILHQVLRELKVADEEVASDTVNQTAEVIPDIVITPPTDN